MVPFPIIFCPFHFYLFFLYRVLIYKCLTLSFWTSCNSKTSVEIFCACLSTPGLNRTSQVNVGFGLPPSLTQAKLNSEFSLTGTKIFPASKRRESINRYGGFGRSVKKN